MKHILYIILCLYNVMLNAQAGPSALKDDNTRDALKIPLNKSGTHYFQARFCKQLRMRYNRAMNPANSTALNSTNSISGRGPVYGNTFPTFGSGNVVYAQLEYLLPEGIIKNDRLIPNLSATMTQFDRLEGQPMNLYNAVINWLIWGHNAKITADWQSRPTYFIDSNSRVQSGSRKTASLFSIKSSFKNY